MATDDYVQLVDELKAEVERLNGELRTVAENLTRAECKLARQKELYDEAMLHIQAQQRDKNDLRDKLARAREVNRYDLEFCGMPYVQYQEMVERKDGDWVRFDDLLAALDAGEGEDE